ncbi:MAG: hypothetical protein GY910_26770 [bacterium]|nr:hypothetical protein [bacterium]
MARRVITYPSPDDLIGAIVTNIQPAGFFVPTPFAAGVGTKLLIRIILELEGEAADPPAAVVASIIQDAHTLSTKSMGMSVKIQKPTPAQGAGISEIFDATPDEKLGLGG